MMHRWPMPGRLPTVPAQDAGAPARDSVKRVTVFGGTGFLGRHIVEALLKDGMTVRVAARHPQRVAPPQGHRQRVEPVPADVRDEGSVAEAIDQSQGVVNAVGLYVERGGATFRAIHVEGARRVAAMAKRAGVQRLVHISGIGSDPASPSEYVRVRGEGEQAVQAAFNRATIFRPSVMFGSNDAFLNTLKHLVRWLPAVPLFGRGATRLQPVFVGDVAKAATRAMSDPDAPGRIYELGGPEVVTYRELVEWVMKATEHRRLLVPVPFLIWDALAALSSLLPSPPLTEGQVALLKRHNVANPQAPGLRQLDVTPHPLGIVLNSRPHP